MSETSTLEGLQKKRTELENQWSSQLQRQKTLEGNIKALEEKVQTQLQQKIKSEDEVLGTLESKRKDLEKRLEELQERRETSQRLDEPTTEVIQTKEQVQEQPAQMTAAANFGDQSQWQNEEAKEKHKEDKKRKFT